MDTPKDITEINAKLGAILGKVAVRTAGWELSFLDGNALNFMTPEERTERHALIQSAPTFGEEALAAKARIRERIALRRAISKQHKVAAA
jgi:hypothetical protein